MARRPADPDLGDGVGRATEACRGLLVGVADRWEIFAKASTTRESEIVDGGLRRSVEIEECGLGVRLTTGGRVGFAAASGLEASAARTAVDAARAGAVPGPDPMPPARLLGTTPIAAGPELPPRGWAQHVAVETAVALAKLSNGRLKLGRAIAQEGRYAWSLSTAEDWSATDARVAASLMVEAFVGGGTGTWREWIHIADFEQVDPEAVAARIADRALLTEHPVVVDQGLHDLLLHPEVAAQLLGAISPLFLATPADDDPLPGLLDRDGLLASYELTVVDDRADPAAPLVGPCDGEGLPARRTLLLEEGAPRHRIASFADARRFDETPRGGAVRVSYRDRVRTGLSNLRVLTDGGRPAAELLAASTRALYLVQPLAPVVCDFAADSYRLVASGVWIDRQRVRGWHPVVELSGGLGTLLRRVEAVGADLRWFQTPQGVVGSPSILVRRQPVIG